ncbi:iron-containing alcohol dehydrogenase [Halalkalibacterium ligniniphilum]|uniref:iron-containing alcohol dehydrogenase n=1 Tax=Halalkalibacterium ligniniphilum TaxID=1134413 RepID=UPI00034BA2BC|nr:iron-containing alcohol dehydrogenase [Halalkalibacterium ligniniphilum]
MNTIQSYNYYMPTNVVSEVNSSKRTGEIVKDVVQKKVLIVTDKGIRDAGLLEGVIASLESVKLSYAIFDQVEPNPKAETIGIGVTYLKENDCDAVIGIGGGSSIDTAKAIAFIATSGGHVLDYEGVGMISTSPLPIIAIPTTAGTGSEVTASTVITNEKTLFKAAVISPYLFPKIAILDPVLAMKCPPSITAATGMDALTHAIESYVSKLAQPVSQALALQAIKLISRNLRNAYFVGTDLKSRSEMLEASMLAGFAFSQSRLGNVHAISQAFGGVFDIPHGIANATLLPFVLKYNLPACPEKMKDIAEAMGADVSRLSTSEAASKVLEMVIELNEAFDIPSNIKDLGVSLNQLPKLIEDSMRSGNILANPRLTNANDVKTIIEDAYYGKL